MIVEEEQKGEKRAAYGQSQIKSLAQTLRKEFGKGFTTRNLLNMRAFYLQNPIWHSVSTKLTWTHYRILLRVQNSKAREWYAQEAIENAWTVRALDRQIDKLYYERILMSKDKAPVIQEAENHIKQIQLDAKNYLRDPYILDFLNLPYQPVVETELEHSLIRIYDEHRKGTDDNPTIGLILCSEKNETIAKYSVLKDSKQLFASKYLRYLPTEEELRVELERERAALNQVSISD